MNKAMRPMVILLITGVLLSLPLISGADPLHEAIQNNDTTMVQSLILEAPDQLESRDSNNNTPLHVAVLENNTAIAKMLLTAGAEVDAGDNEGSPALITAAMRGYLDMARLLISKGADVGYQDNFGNTAITFAAIGGSTEMIELLIEEGADIHVINGEGATPLTFAAGRGRTDAVRLLLAKGADATIRNNQGQTIAFGVAARGHTDMLRLLVDNGADLLVSDSSGGTILHEAAISGSVVTVDYLLDAGADPDLTNDFGATPLIFSSWRSHVDVARTLLEKGANPDIINTNGMTALHNSVKEGSVEMCQVLLTNGANASLPNLKTGGTPLHYACTKGYLNIVELLVSSGADLTVKDNKGLTPLHYAGKYGHRTVADLLLAKGVTAPDMEKNFGRCPLLEKSLSDGEGIVWYIGHSGWAIKTQNNLLVFDYWERNQPPTEALISNGHISAEEVKNLNVTVFVSHEHGDHFDTNIFKWRETIPNITYIMGFENDGVSGYRFIGPRQTETVGNMEVSTITSNDSGVGFLIKVDGLTIFQAADHANRLRDFSGPYTAEIDYLADMNLDIDIAFMPISGCGFGDLEAVKLGVYYALDKLKPKVFFPEHALDNEYRYQEFADRAVADGHTDCEYMCAFNKGDRFFYRNGKIVF
ncbi:MAG: ankyrin repeat domain-containing protein [candidate division Zixibacteria bacterium]|nr:ankyrin repeat domain-containing protein [candidate division Zixibacteria bacterium]